MLNVIRAVVSLIVSAEMLITGIIGGAKFTRIEMPETETGTYGSYVDPFIGGPANSDAEVYRRGCKLPIEQAGL